MEAHSGKIFEFEEASMAAFKRLVAQQSLIPLDEPTLEELKPLSPPKRKNLMRNKPCVCGSGKKFKRCCWNNYL